MPRARGQALQHRRQIVFARAVKTARAFGIDVAHQPIGSHHGGLAVFIVDRAVDDQKVIAHRIEAVEIAAQAMHLG